MEKYIFLFILAICSLGLSKTADRIVLNGAINAVTTEFISESIEQAERDGAELLVIEMDTPGGAMSSMHEIMKAFQSSTIPVIVYVSPSGSRAGSAGVFICYAAHITAMAPSTNIGSAHPVFMPNVPGVEIDSSSMGTMMDKVVNDAVAKIRAIATTRGRNADWAEKAIRESANITAREALELKVIDYVSPSLDSLFKLIDGKEVKLDNGTSVILSTKDLSLRLLEMSWRERLLDMISDPNISFVLLILAIFGFVFEIYNPGGIIPGVIGAIALVLWLFSTQILPVNYVGVLLILLAVVLFLLEIKIPSFGMLTIGGVISLVMGSIMLFEGGDPSVQVSWPFILGVVVACVLFFVLAIGLTVRIHKQKAATGKEGMIGEKGIAYTALNPNGTVKLHGEFWKAESDESVKKGQRVIVVDYDGKELVLHVKSDKK